MGKITNKFRLQAILRKAYWRYLPKSIKKVKSTYKIGTIFDFIKKGIQMSAFFKSHFTYWLLIWLCCNRSLNNKIKRLPKRCPRILYSNKKSNFEELLERDGSVSNHHPNIRSLLIEMFKDFQGVNPQILKRFFGLEMQHLTSLENRQIFKSHLYIVFSVEKVQNFSDQIPGKFYLMK